MFASPSSRNAISLLLAAGCWILLCTSDGAGQEAQLYNGTEISAYSVAEPQPAPSLHVAAADAEEGSATRAATLESPQPAGKAPLRLVPLAEEEPAQQPTGWPALMTSASSLAVVLALFGLFIWAMRKYGGTAATGTSGPAMQVISTMPLGPRQSASLIRCGRRIVLVGLSNQGSRTLAEFRDPEEVAELMETVSGQSDFRGVLSRAVPRGKTKAYPSDYSLPGGATQL